MQKTLLLNCVCYRPVGHMVEALKYAKGYHKANPNLDIYLMINSETPFELGLKFKWIKKILPISISEVSKNEENAACLQGIPLEWDYIITDYRLKKLNIKKDHYFLVKTQTILQKIFTARIKQGITNEFSGFYPFKQKQPLIIPYFPNQVLEIPIPKKSLILADKILKHNGPKIAIMLGGSAGKKQSPSVKMWLKICKSLMNDIPNLKILITGKKNTDNGTTTRGFTVKEIKYLQQNLQNSEIYYDLNIWDQLALIKKCDIFLSPHTGFAFLAPCVGTPWLTLSCCRWPEYILNNLKFYSVLPDCGYYPAQNETKKGCGKQLKNNKKCFCMTDRLLDKKIPEIISAAKLLLDKKFTYKKALEFHLNKLKTKPDINLKKIYFFDGIENLTNDVKIKSKFLNHSKIYNFLYSKFTH